MAFFLEPTDALPDFLNLLGRALFGVTIQKRLGAIVRRHGLNVDRIARGSTQRRGGVHIDVCRAAAD